MQEVLDHHVTIINFLNYCSVQDEPGQLSLWPGASAYQNTEIPGP